MKLFTCLATFALIAPVAITSSSVKADVRSEYFQSRKDRDEAALSCQRWLKSAYDSGQLRAGHNTQFYVVHRQTVYSGKPFALGDTNSPRCGMVFRGFLGRQNCNQYGCQQWVLEGDDLVVYSKGREGNYDRGVAPEKIADWHMKAIHNAVWNNRYEDGF